MASTDFRSTPPGNGATEGTAGSQRIKLILAWLFVGIPAAWGIVQVFKRALALFQ